MFLAIVGLSSAFAMEKYLPDARAQASLASSSQTAAVTSATITYKKVGLESKALVAYARNFKKGSKEIIVAGRIEAYYSENKKFEAEDQPLKFVLVSGKDVYEIKTLKGSLPLSLNGAAVELLGFTSLGRDGKKELVVDLSASDIKNLSTSSNRGMSLRDERSNCPATLCSIVIPVDMSGDISNLPAPEDIENYINNGRIANAILEESYAQASLSVRVMPWVSISSQTMSPYYAPSEIEQYLINQGIDLSSYGQLAFLINGGSQSSGGEATIGAQQYYANGSSYNIPVSLVGFAPYANNANLTSSNGNMSYFDYLYVHETGHNLGALHDNLLNCGGGPMSLPSQCISIEYGNKYSIMGDAAYGGHFSLVQKLRAGWVGMPPLVTSGIYSFDPIELANPSFLGIDGNTNYIPEFLMERRTSVGIDALSLFTDPNLNGVFLYRMKNPTDPNLSSDPMTWDVGLIDTTPTVASTNWYTSLNDLVFKIPQRYGDIQNNTRFSQRLDGMNNSVQVSQGLQVADACAKKPVKAFEPYVNSGDTFTGQIPSHKWPVRTGLPTVAASLVQDIHADTSLPDAQIFLIKYFMLFNDDAIPCGPGEYSFEIIFNGESIPLLTDSSATYNPWSGPNYDVIMAYLPVSGLSYGQHTATLKITKLNDGSVFSRPLVFNLVP